MRQDNFKFKWHEETGLAIAVIYTPYGVFTGEAECHPDDRDMMSEKVGCEIAYTRAVIDALVFERDNRIKPSLASLKQLYYSMKHSKKFNPKSYENRMLRRQIQNWELDLHNINSIIRDQRLYLTDYIKTKETLYQSVRKNRQGQK